MRAPFIVLGAGLLCGLAAAACGKKGPPLAPLVRIPGAIEQVSARRVGDDVYVTVRVPSQNIDASMPVDIGRVDVYGATATAPPARGRFLEIAELVSSVKVAAPPPNVKAGPPAPSAMITVRDVLAPQDLEPRALTPQPAAGRRTPLPLTPEPPRGEIQRFYLAIPFSTRGRPGPQGVVAALPLTPLPEAPEAVEARYAADAVTVSWQPSGGVIGFLLNRSLPPEPPPFDEFVVPTAPAAPPLAPNRSTALPTPSGRGARQPLPSVPLAPPLSTNPVASAPQGQAAALFGPTRYNIYRELTVDPLLLLPSTSRPASEEASPPPPLNAAPLDALTFADELEFERERCYVIRAVRVAGTNVTEGYGSERVCIRPVDIFPPGAPTGLSAVGAEGSISLIWEANPEDDVAGYLVLRGASADATLHPITSVPIVETQFTDRDVMPGARYVYAVVAVDGRVPLPNVSAESMRVEEMAR